MTLPTLYEFRFSHFNEKARWALDRAGVRYDRATQLPGMHMRQVKAVSGQSSTPVLVTGDRTIVGSHAIAEWAHKCNPGAGLLPDAQATVVRQHCQTLDEAVGAPLRRALFHHLLATRPVLVAQLFGTDQRAGKRMLLRAMLPALSPMLRRLDQINADTAQDGIQRLDATLDRLAEERGDRPYLVGHALSLADITAGSLLFPLALPDELPFTIAPAPRSAIEQWAQPYARHRTVLWVRDLYRTHRASTRAAQQVAS